MGPRRVIKNPPMGPLWVTRAAALEAQAEQLLTARAATKPIRTTLREVSCQGGYPNTACFQKMQ